MDKISNLSYFYSCSKKNKITPKPQLLLLKKLDQLKSDGKEPFDLYTLWTLYRKDEPSSLFNGIFELYQNIADCERLWKKNLIEFTQISENPFFLKASIETFVIKTPEYPSRYVVITEKGQDKLKKLKKWEKKNL